MSRMMESGRFPRKKHAPKGRRLVEREALSWQNKTKDAFQKSKKGAGKLFTGFRKYQEGLQKAAPGLDPFSEKFMYKEKKKR